MTDTTELAQSMKAAAEKATAGQWERGDGKHGGELLVYCDDALGSAVCEATSEYNAIPKYQRIYNLDFIAMANPANILALVEALEKAQGMETYWKTQCRGITDHCEELQARIAELESRSVKLPTRIENIGLRSPREVEDMWIAKVKGMLTAAGIEVEA